MEYINKVDLQGRVGAVRLDNIQGRNVASFSVVTEFVWQGENGQFFNECTWHQVSAWDGENVCDLTLLTKGCIVKLIGRLRHTRYTSADGTEKTFTEVLASELSIINE